MQFSLKHSIEILENTPHVLEAYLSHLSQDWLHNNEGEHTWSPYDVIGHLIYGEKTDWMVRVKIILNDSQVKLFEPFDRFAQLNHESNLPIKELLAEFKALRTTNLKKLNALAIESKDLTRTGTHPDFGEVTLKQLIASWVAHDLGHIAQISRVMAKQYKNEVGPWVNYLNILTR